jgi:5-methylcytosine-specific restriction endonuclease McrA
MTQRRCLSSKDKRKRKLQLYALQAGKCFWCDIAVPENASTIDELLPRNRGGTQRWDNVVMSCGPCNWRRGDYVAPKWAFEKVRERELDRSALPPADRQVTKNMESSQS